MNDISISNNVTMKMSRMDYIDAMRGFSMVLVVFGHILLSMGFPTNTKVLGAVLLTFRMPLFFCVSGFFAFKVVDKWSNTYTIDIFKRKVKAQVLCTFTFYAIFQICHDQSVLDFMHRGFSWFWFTIVLFQMFAIYMIVSLIGKKIGSDRFVVITLLVLTSVSLYLYINATYLITSVWIPFDWYYLVQYFQFFVIGIFFRKFDSYFFRLIQLDSIKSFFIIGYVILLVATINYKDELYRYNHTFFSFLDMELVRYFGLVTIFIFFVTYQSFFQSETKLSKWLRFVGTRTLDIYMLHVFFLPNLLFLSSYLAGTDMTLILIILGTTLAVINIGICLLISQLLRCSSIISSWLFGQKTTNKTNKALLFP